MRVNQNRVCGDVEVFVFDNPIRASAIEVKYARNASARDDVMCRNFTASLAHEKRFLIDVEVRKRVRNGFPVRP